MHKTVMALLLLGVLLAVAADADTSQSPSAASEGFRPVLSRPMASKVMGLKQNMLSLLRAIIAFGSVMTDLLMSEFKKRSGLAALPFTLWFGWLEALPAATQAPSPANAAGDRLSTVAEVEWDGRQLGREQTDGAVWLSLKPRIGGIQLLIFSPGEKQPVRLSSPTTLVEVVDAGQIAGGLRLSNIQAARIPGPIGQRCKTPFKLPVYRISP